MHYNVTSRRFRGTLFVAEKQNVLHILAVFVASYPISNAHAQYCHLWPARLYNIFRQYLKNSTIFEKNVIEHRIFVAIFFTTFVRNISYSKKN